MPTRDDIIYGIRDYSAHEVAQAIINRIVTIPEILDENAPEFSTSMRTDVEKELWKYVSGNPSLSNFDLYLENYPSPDRSNHTYDARDARERIMDPTATPPKIEPAPEPVTPVKEELPPVPDFFPEVNYVDDSFPSMPPIPPIPPVMSDPWDTVDKNSVEELEKFRENYPDHEKYIEAGRLINSLDENEFLPSGPEWLKDEISRIGASDQARTIINAYNNRQITHSELVGLFAENHNFVNRNVASELVRYGVLTSKDLRKAGIDDNFINVLRGTYVGLVENKVNTTYMENPEMITMKSQEFYFWGMPASGKTCALGAILSAASSGEVADSLNPYVSCNGYAYLNQLRGTFQPGKISELPPGTNEDFVADMSFELIDKDKKAHYITLIDIAGELLDTMRRIDENDKNNITDTAMNGYKSMINLLVDKRSTNSKIHFFVVEYGGHDRVHKGMKQADLLDAALSHIHARGVLRNSDAVYILMTKVDMALNQPGDINEVLEKYLFEHYHGFYNRLKTMTREHSIKRLGFIPFSIGEVCFKNLCRFDKTAANYVVETFIEDTRGEKTGKLGKIFGTLRG